MSSLRDAFGMPKRTRDCRENVSGIQMSREVCAPDIVRSRTVVSGFGAPRGQSQNLVARVKRSASVA
jgi:hypothetical protein